MAPVSEAANTSAETHPRPSPDGKQVAFLTHDGDQLVLSVTSVAEQKTKVVAKFTGSTGALSANPWSPDGKRLVFISRQSVN
jgi:Tol biopolymer transport system component